MAWICTTLTLVPVQPVSSWTLEAFCSPPIPAQLLLSAVLCGKVYFFLKNQPDLHAQSVVMSAAPPVGWGNYLNVTASDASRSSAIKHTFLETYYFQVQNIQAHLNSFHLREVHGAETRILFFPDWCFLIYLVRSCAAVSHESSDWQNCTGCLASFPFVAEAQFDVYLFCWVLWIC